MDDEFGFLLCEWCQRDVKDPKLLPCLHNFCTECLEGSMSVGKCLICSTPHSQNTGTPMENNVLFGNLQAKLGIYQKVLDGKDLLCNSCQKAAGFWCLECNEFFCVTCFEFHQKYVKDHQTKSLTDLKAEFRMGFLAWIRKSSIVSCSNHTNEPLRHYCPECKQHMCRICAQQDSKHISRHNDIKKEIQERQEQLQSMSLELMKKKSSYSDICERLKTFVEEKENMMHETRKLIQLLGKVNKQQKQEVQDIKANIEQMEEVLKRMTSSGRLVEKMRLYAQGHEVMAMHPFIRNSLEELQRNQPPTLDFMTETKNLTEGLIQLQAVIERVTGKEEASSASLQKASNQGCSVKSSAKRKNVKQEKAVQTPVKVMKTEPEDNQGPSRAPVGVKHVAGGGLKKENNIDSQVPSCISQTNVKCHSSLTGINRIPTWDNSLITSTGVSCCPEEGNSDDESVDSDLLEDTDDKLENSQTGGTTYSFSSPKVLSSGQGTLVFFDMKNLPGRILQLVAVKDISNIFPVTIQPQPFLERGDLRANLCERGLDNFLHNLTTLHMPILVGYDLWSMDLPNLVKSLEAINKDNIFEETIFGFLDAFPLIKQKKPDAPSYTLKNLYRHCFSGQLDNTNPEDCAKAVMKLCTTLDVNQMMLGERVIPYSSLRCYISLQPLLEEKLLSKTSAQTLALHNVDLSRLQLVYQENTAFGLQRFCQSLNSRLRPTEKKIKHLSKIRSHFQARSLANWICSPATNK